MAAHATPGGEVPADCRADGYAPTSRPDPCVVATAELSPLVRAFADRWAHDHRDLADGSWQPPTPLRRRSGQFTGSNRVVGAITILHERTKRVDPQRKGVHRDTIRNVLTQRNKTTELWIADALLCAVNEANAFHDGRVSVRPNPAVGAAGRALCCGGSLDGGGELR